MKKIRDFSTFSKIMMVLIAVLGLLLTIAALMENAGYVLIQSGLSLLGMGLLIWLLPLWGGVALFKKIRNRGLRLFGSLIGGTVLLAAGLAGIFYLGQINVMAMPAEYAKIPAPDKGSIVVLRRLDTGMESEEATRAMLDRMDMRYDYLLEDPSRLSGIDAETEFTYVPLEERKALQESDGSDMSGIYPVGCFGYVYTAYPTAFFMFYDTNVPSEGAIYIGYDSKAEMKYQWQEDGTVRLYLENAMPGDSGEIIVG